MTVNRRVYLSWVGAWLVGFAALAAGMDDATAAALLVACSPEQPVVRAGGQVTVRAWASAPEGTSLRYFWTVEDGRVTKQAAEVVWDLAGVRQSPTPYKARVRVLGPAGMMSDCTLQVVVAPPSYGTEVFRGRETGGTLLPTGQPEVEGYGLYSYLLFGAPPEGEDRERYLQAVAAYLTLIPHLAALEEYFKRHELNVIYLPTLELPPDMQPVTPEWVLTHYDYARTRSLMRALPGGNRAGPYLISTLDPLSKTTVTPEQYLFQDLSAVPPHLVSLWVREFLNQAAQQDITQKSLAAVLGLRVRTTIAQLAIVLPDVEAAIKRLGFLDIGAFVKTSIAWKSP